MFFVTLVLVSPRYVFSLLEPLKYVWPAPAAVYARFARCQRKVPICRHLRENIFSNYAVDTLYTLFPEIHVKRVQE